MVLENTTAQFCGYKVFAAPSGTPHSTFPRFQKAGWDMDQEDVWHEIATGRACFEGFDLAAWREQPYLVIRTDELWVGALWAGERCALIIDSCDHIGCSFSSRCQKRWVYLPRAMCITFVYLGAERSKKGDPTIIRFGDIDFDGAEHVENGVVRPGLPELVQTGDAQ